MNPLTESERYRIIQADSFEILRKLPDGFVDHIICDPPYTDRVHRNISNVVSHGNKGKRRAHQSVEFAPLSEYGFVADMLRASRRWVLCCAAFEQIQSYTNAADAVHPTCWINCGVFHKFNSTPQFTGDRPGQPCEAVAIMHRKGKKRWNGGGGHAFWEHARDGESERVHPTQKPLKFMIELILQFTNPGEVILDPFCGYGTTVIACLATGRRVIGIDNGIRGEQEDERFPELVGLSWAELTERRAREYLRGSKRITVAKQSAQDKTIWMFELCKS